MVEHLEDQRLGRELRASCPQPERQDHLREAKAAQRKQRKKILNKRLQTVARRDLQRIQITRMRIDGNMSYDRELWSQRCHSFGQARFGCDANGPLMQEERFQRFAALARNDMLDGKVGKPTLWDVLQARAQLGGGAAGPDLVPPEVFRRLPLQVVLHVHALFCDYALLRP